MLRILVARYVLSLGKELLWVGVEIVKYERAILCVYNQWSEEGAFSRLDQLSRHTSSTAR